MIRVDTRPRHSSAPETGPVAPGGRARARSKSTATPSPPATSPSPYPYGIYDIATNTGWVNVGTDHDTAEFAVESIRRWRQRLGQVHHPDATWLLITANAGGSNDSRSWT